MDGTSNWQTSIIPLLAFFRFASAMFKLLPGSMEGVLLTTMIMSVIITERVMHMVVVWADGFGSHIIGPLLLW